MQWLWVGGPPNNQGTPQKNRRKRKMRRIKYFKVGKYGKSYKTGWFLAWGIGVVDGNQVSTAIIETDSGRVENIQLSEFQFIDRPVR